MKAILTYIRQYLYEINKITLTWITVFTALLVFLNYYFAADDSISDHENFFFRTGARWIIFFLAFAVPYLLITVNKKAAYSSHPPFIFLLLLAPLLFAIKTALPIYVQFSSNNNWNSYWNQVIYWPILVLIIGSLLFFIWWRFDRDQPFYGMTVKDLDLKPYLLMLLIMIPLITLASTQADFLAVYPKLKMIAEVYNEPGLEWWHKLLFELSYGTDFITIELFFRGFLILAFIKWAGKDAILPMACFYCTIHFGKPLGECISSYFGGILLGIVVYNTRSMIGGLIVHVGIAWLMELGGYLGQ